MEIIENWSSGWETKIRFVSDATEGMRLRLTGSMECDGNKTKEPVKIHNHSANPAAVQLVLWFSQRFARVIGERAELCKLLCEI